MRVLILLLLFSSAAESYCQDSTSIAKDTVTTLEEVTVHGYANDRPLSEVPAAIGSVNGKDLERFSNTSFLQAVNTLPGVRMEERSPGSYRFAIRGSSLRSPFGVRNVKMYWNGLPLTDGGGNTYLNLVDFNALGNAEIIKGPGGSLYGAGTGGVALLTSPMTTQNQFQLSAIGGSYGLQRYQVNAAVKGETSNLNLNYAHQQSDGYREHTRMKRDAFNADLRFKLSEKSTLSPTLFYTSLFYQTPGGLTKGQYDADPKQARPPGALPGAVEQDASVENNTIYGGVVYDLDLSPSWTSIAGVFGSITDFTNPTIRNYELRKENNFGGRLENQYHFHKARWSGKITFGGEYQRFASSLTDYDNIGGSAGDVQTDDRLYANLLLLFGQAELELPSDFFLTVSGSGNFVSYEQERVSSFPSVNQQSKFEPEFLPRVALLKKLSERFSIYGSFSRGFSPPSLAEVRPSTGNFNEDLTPEIGDSFEMGIRGRILNRLSFDFTAYDFELDHTIVVQQQINGADYFHNSGNTSQKGIEATISWTPLLKPDGSWEQFKVWGSYTFNHYRFIEYVKDSVDYSGNDLTGAAPQIVAAGLDVGFKRIYANLTFNYVDKIPLDDGNTAYSDAYFLTGFRLGYRWELNASTSLEFFGGADNLADVRYSLGNDINAQGQRYYNVAPGRNFYVGIKLMGRK